MNRIRPWRSISIAFILALLLDTGAGADGGFVSRIQSVAISADQRAIIIKNGDEISITFSTGYTGEGDDFGWIIPTPVPPAIENVEEAGKAGETAFENLDEITAPVFELPRRPGRSSGGCFPAGTEVLTPDGPRPIETVSEGTDVFSYDFLSAKWTVAKALKQQAYLFEGDMVTIELGSANIVASGNHSFYVERGNQLDLRPKPQEVPIAEQSNSGSGRWIEARHLEVGDLLKTKGGESLTISSVSKRDETQEVYHLEVERYHNFAVHRSGILVHNGGKGESASEGAALEAPVRVYGNVILEHYEVSILGASGASALLDWLEENGYQVNPSATEILDAYIHQGWAFVAVKLNPSEKQAYHNEFLPPLTVRFSYDHLIFPLRISSVSTAKTAKITLYVIAESTITSSNFQTALLEYEPEHTDGVDPEIYIERCIRKTIQSDVGGGLAVLWSGEFSGRHYRPTYIDQLRQHIPMQYLTRLETRMDAMAMTDDIKFMLDPSPREFEVHIKANGGYRSVLSEAARTNDREMLYMALDLGVDANARFEDGRTPLMEAASSGHIEIIDLLLNNGADVNAEGYARGRTALLEAISGSIAELHGIEDLKKTVKILLAAGADANVGGGTALIEAAKQGDPELMQILREAGAEATVDKTQNGQALLNAALNGETEVVRILLLTGADVNALNSTGYSALAFAARRGHAGVVQVLLEAGADIHAGESGMPVLLYAAFGGNADVVQMILQAGADVNEAEDGLTALMQAAVRGHADVTLLLLEAGADVNARDRMGYSALMFAATYGHGDVVKILLEASADIYLVNSDNGTARGIAKKKNFTEIVRLIDAAAVDAKQ